MLIEPVQRGSRSHPLDII